MSSEASSTLCFHFSSNNAVDVNERKQSKQPNRKPNRDSSPQKEHETSSRFLRLNKRATIKPIKPRNQIREISTCEAVRRNENINSDVEIPFSLRNSRWYFVKIDSYENKSEDMRITKKRQPQIIDETKERNENVLETAENRRQFFYLDLLFSNCSGKTRKPIQSLVQPRNDCHTFKHTHLTS
ncbi:hypothetical protein YC2023_081252 [Brassica napus]